jgi:hypothetical protein
VNRVPQVGRKQRMAKQQKKKDSEVPAVKCKFGDVDCDHHSPV